MPTQVCLVPKSSSLITNSLLAFLRVFHLLQADTVLDTADTDSQDKRITE